MVQGEPANASPLVQELFANVGWSSGAVIISAAGGAEYAFEDDRWQNGVFTYTVFKGLETGLADKNEDRQVRASETQAYVIEHVRRRTGGRQTPTVRQENLEFDFRVH